MLHSGICYSKHISLFKEMNVSIHVLLYFSEEESGTVQLVDLLGFITGCSAIPISGFESRPTIQFRHQDDLDAQDMTKEYPVVNTCINIIQLPVLNRQTYRKFKLNMTNALKMPRTFTKL